MTLAVKVALNPNTTNQPQSRLLTTLKKGPFENFVGKEENAGNPAFSSFPAMYKKKAEIIFSATYKLLSATALNLVLLKKKKNRRVSVIPF